MLTVRSTVKMSVVAALLFLSAFLGMHTPLLAYSSSSDPLDDTSVRLFAGYRGDMAVIGQLTNLKVSRTASLQFGVESQIGAIDSTGIKPINVNFGFGFKLDSMGFYHDCGHDLDANATDSRVRGYTRNRVYYDF